MIDSLIARLPQPIIVATDTVFGVAAPATKEGISFLYNIKHRPSTQPLPIMVSSFEEAESLVRIPQAVKPFLQQVWPGPFTFVAESLSKELSDIMSTPTLGVRVPGHPELKKLLATYQNPLAVTSANISGQLTVSHEDHLSESIKASALYIQKQSCTYGIESTVALWSNNAWEVLRLGALSLQTLLAHAPTHYQPPAPKGWCEVEPFNNQSFYVSFGDSLSPWNLSPTSSMAEACQNLYPILHALSKEKAQYISVGPLPDHPLRSSVYDALLRAVAPRDGLEPPTK